MNRFAELIIGALLAGAGYLCLNYTSAFGIEQNAAWAAEHELPAPTHTIFLAGAAIGAFGALLAGHALGRPSRRV
jgi:hypothetical protein